MGQVITVSQVARPSTSGASPSAGSGQSELDRLRNLVHLLARDRVRDRARIEQLEEMIERLSGEKRTLLHSA